jgi:hypothetical protein
MPSKVTGETAFLYGCQDLTLMDRVTVIPHKPKASALPEEWPAELKNDPRWELAQRMIAGTHFARSPLLSKFLLFVAAETIEGRGDEITEHQIGVHVFDRPADYRTLEDNIVRSYARQLRKRLAEYFAGEGRSEAWRVDIPLGGYVPVFSKVSEEDRHRQAGPVPVELKANGEDEGPGTDRAEAGAARRPRRLRGLGRGLLLVAYSAALVAATWLVVRSRTPRTEPEPAHVLWAALFGGSANSYIVPSDAGFNLLEDLSHRPVPLAEYIQGSYRTLPLGGVDAHSAADLRSQQFTPFVDFQVVAALARLPEAKPERIFIRFPRDLRLDDLKNSNAVILGSVGSNPWAAVAESNANFRIVDSPGMESAAILNLKPQPGEAPSYASHWNEPAHETFALIAFLPNLSGSGHLLVLQGLDVAGTQAAAEMLFHPSGMEQILQRATRPDGSLRNFEVLLRSTSIESNATGTQVIASRIY